MDRFRELFEALKVDKEESLSGDTVSLDKIRPQTASVLKPLIEELREMGETLDFEEFAASMENLLRLCTPTERAVILQRNRKGMEVMQSRRSERRGESRGVIEDLPVYERMQLHERVPSS